jgi:hypothetical protein
MKTAYRVIAPKSDSPLGLPAKLEHISADSITIDSHTAEISALNYLLKPVLRTREMTLRNGQTMYQGICKCR